MPCRELGELLEEQRHRRVDLLKMDIEGAEYGVIDQILRARLPVRQILVEFHDGILPSVGIRHTVRAVVKLMARGYKLISEVGNDYTFIRQSVGKNQLDHKAEGRLSPRSGTPSGHSSVSNRF